MKKKLYYVRREVYAASLEEAMKAKGTIYSIEIAKDQTDDFPVKGFKPKK